MKGVVAPGMNARNRRTSNVRARTEDGETEWARIFAEPSLQSVGWGLIRHEAATRFVSFPGEGWVRARDGLFSH